jgi:hypothetical protein
LNLLNDGRDPDKAAWLIDLPHSIILGTIASIAMITSADEFVRLRLSQDPQEYRRAALEPAELDVWHAIIRAYPDMRYWVAHNKTVPISVLEILADDPDERVRSAVAMKNKLTPELLEKLASDSSDCVRARLACNRNAPSVVLRRLTEDTCPEVADAARSRVARADLSVMVHDAFIEPYSSHSWASARGRSHWRELELLQDAMAGPVCSVIKGGGCEYVYTRDEQYFAGVDSPDALRLRLTQWHSEFASRVSRFEPASNGESVDLVFMQDTVQKMLDVIQFAADLELKHWRALHSD